MFLSSTNTSETVRHSPTELTDVLENVKEYLNTIPKVHCSERISEIKTSCVSIFFFLPFILF